MSEAISIDVKGLGYQTFIDLAGEAAGTVELISNTDSTKQIQVLGLVISVDTAGSYELLSDEEVIMLLNLDSVGGIVQFAETPLFVCGKGESLSVTVPSLTGSTDAGIFLKYILK